MAFEITFQGKQSAGRCGILKSRGNIVDTPCCFLDTQKGLPTFCSLNQLSKAKLPPHGYVLDLGDILYFSSTDAVSSSYDQPSKGSKKKNKGNNSKSNHNQSADTKSKATADSESKPSADSESKPSAKGVLQGFYEYHNQRPPSASIPDSKPQKNINSIHSFTMMHDFILMLDHRSLIFSEPQQGSKDSVVLVTDHGKKKLSVQEYVYHAGVINADFYTIPSEDVLMNVSSSRCDKNVKRTLKLFCDGLAAHSNGTNGVLQSIPISVVQGGCDKRYRVKCCTEMMKEWNQWNAKSESIDYGFMIGGIGNGASPKQKQLVLSTVTQTLNDNEDTVHRLRIVNGIDSLDDVLLAIANGCDIMMSAYPTLLTRDGMCAVYLLCLVPCDCYTTMYVDVQELP